MHPSSCLLAEHGTPLRTPRWASWSPEARGHVLDGCCPGRSNSLLLFDLFSIMTRSIFRATCYIREIVLRVSSSSSSNVLSYLVTPFPLQRRYVIEALVTHLQSEMLIESELLVEVFQPDIVHVSLFGGGASACVWNPPGRGYCGSCWCNSCLLPTHASLCLFEPPPPFFHTHTHPLWVQAIKGSPEECENCEMVRDGPLKPKCKDSSSLFVFIPNKYREFLQVLDLHISHSMAFGIALTNIAPACYLVCFCQQPGGLR